jgi:hypothetical protein
VPPACPSGRFRASAAIRFSPTAISRSRWSRAGR